MHLFIEDGSLDDDTGDAVGIDVGSRAAILQVSVSLGANMSWDTDGCTTIGNTRAECVDMSRLVTASQPQIIVLSVHRDMLIVSLRQLLDSSFNVLHPSRLTHCLGAVVGVAAGTIPVACKGFRVERNLDTPLFGNTDEEVASHPKMVAHGDAFTWTDLELPLGWHNLGVDTADVDLCVEASTVVGFDEIAGENFAGTSTTVIRALGAWETAFRPTIGSTVNIEQSIFLLETEPRDFGLRFIHNFFRVVTIVGPVGSTIIVVALGEDEDIVTTTERILEDSGGAQVDIGIVARGLVGGGTIKVPDTELANVRDFLAHGRCL